MYPIVMEGPILRLREVVADDVDALHAIYGSEAATEHLSFEPREKEQVLGTIADALNTSQAEPRMVYALAVTSLEDPELIGYARLAVEPHRAGQIGFALNPSRWGRGYGTETVALLLRLAFEQLQLHRVWGARSPKNLASAGVMVANGMSEEGRIRDHVFTHGAWRDSITHAILEGEWRAKR